MVDGLIALMMMVVRRLPDALASPFEYAFMQRALLTALLVGGVCGLLSPFVVLKRWSLLGDAISHAVLPGVAIAYLLGWPFFVGAFIAGTLTALAIAALERHTLLKADAAMGLMFTAAFALGIVIIGKIATNTHLMHILFGNVLGVSAEHLLLTLITTIVVVTVVWLGYRALLIYTFDSTQAHGLGYNTAAIHYGLIVLITLTIVASLETVGIILVVAMLITPGATARLLTSSLPRMIMVSIAAGVIAAVVGLYGSFHFDLASGGAIVLVSTGLFVLALLLSPSHGLLGRLRRKPRVL